MASLPVLVLNSGSSSIKFSVYEAGDGQRTKLHEGAVDGIGTDLASSGSRTPTAKKLVDQTPALPTPRRGLQDGLRRAPLRRLPLPGGHRPSAWSAARPDGAREPAHHS